MLNSNSAVQTDNGAIKMEASQQPEGSQSPTLMQKEVPESENGGASNEAAQAPEAPGSTITEPADKQELSSDETTLKGNDTQLSLASLGEYTFPNRELIGNIEPGTTFPIGKSVLLQANFTSPKTSQEERLVLMEVRNNIGTVTYSSLQGRFADSQNISLELLFQPKNAGDYTIVIFALEPSEFGNTVPNKPLIVVPVKAT
jgi:hypothetical protein